MWKVALFLALCSGDDKEIDDALQRFKTAMKSPDASLRADAVRDLGKNEHEKVLRALGACLETDEKAVRVAAAKALGAWKEKKPAVVAVLAQALVHHSKEPDVAAAILGALEALHDKEALPSAYRYLEDKNEKIAVAAIDVTGAIPSRASIDPLIRLMKKVQNLGDGVYSGGNGGYDVPADERVKEWARHLEEAAKKALSSITGEKHGTPSEWDAWWKRNAATFKVKE